MSDAALVRVERYGARGELVLNRPERKNALTGPLVQQLRAGLEKLAGDPSVAVILIRGEGGTLCAGLDLDAFGAAPPPPWRARFQDDWADFHAAMWACPKMTIGVLEGHAIAGGSSLALSCDLLVAGETARFHVAEVRMGMGAPINVLWLQLKYGAARALEMAGAGQPYTGAELAARGMAVRAVPTGQVVDEARAYADLLAQNKAAGVASVKATIRHLTGITAFRDYIAAAQHSSRAVSEAGPGAGLRPR